MISRHSIEMEYISFKDLLIDSNTDFEGALKSCLHRFFVVLKMREHDSYESLKF